MGAAAFPLRDHFQLIEPGATLTIHGPVKWFEGHTYEPLQVVRKAKIGESDSKPVADAAQGAPPADGQGAPNQDAGTPTSPSPAPAAPPVVAPRGPEIPLKPEANTNELSTRACVKGYGFYEPLIVALYCLITSIATAGICFLIYLSYIKSEGASAGRKAK